jgi:drug/metabolite transporter (DMT)-like permease
VMLGWIWGGEKFPAWSLLGAGLVLVGVWLIFRPLKHRELAEAAAGVPERG